MKIIRAIRIRSLLLFRSFSSNNFNQRLFTEKLYPNQLLQQFPPHYQDQNKQFLLDYIHTNNIKLHQDPVFTSIPLAFSRYSAFTLPKQIIGTLDRNTTKLSSNVNIYQYAPNELNNTDYYVNFANNDLFSGYSTKESICSR